MADPNPIRVIIDTNLWISFLIGKELAPLKNLIVEGKIKLIITPQLIDEITDVTSRAKFRKYFPKSRVAELIELLQHVSESFNVDDVPAGGPDPKDDFLFALAKISHADFLVTGDKPLLEMKTFSQTQIVTSRQFIDKFR